MPGPEVSLGDLFSAWRCQGPGRPRSSRAGVLALGAPSIAWRPQPGCRRTGYKGLPGDLKAVDTVAMSGSCGQQLAGLSELVEHLSGVCLRCCTVFILLYPTMVGKRTYSVGGSIRRGRVKTGERVPHWSFDPTTIPTPRRLAWTSPQVRGSEAPRPFQPTRLQTSTVLTALIRNARNGTNPSWVAIRFTASSEYKS